jgi:hypothetical protein
MVLPRTVFKPQLSMILCVGSTARFAIGFPVETIPTVSPSFKKGGCLNDIYLRLIVLHIFTVQHDEPLL